jgi:hypothetical protein
MMSPIVSRSAMSMPRHRFPWVIGSLLLGLSLLAGCKSTDTTFDTKEAAMEAFVKAAERGDTAAMATMLGPGGEEIVSSGDEVRDARGLEHFVAIAREKTAFEDYEGESIVVLGNSEWPLPIPLVEEDGSWRFDAAAAKEEILSRRIGRNELTTIAVCHAYADAQAEYARQGRDGNPRAYAQRLKSTPGKHDGLYWEAAEGEEESPMGDLVAMAADEGYAMESKPAEYHGYIFKSLRAQGPNAPGGARSYVKDGLMTGGFALLAWPIEYDNSGIMTFIVNQQGVLFQKDLGPETAKLAPAIEAYDPDGSWHPTGD